MPRTPKAPHPPQASQAPTEGDGMANKIEIRPPDKKDTTGDSGGNDGS
ncbi:hypothetical protein [Streptomyces sp. NPDC021139]